MQQQLGSTAVATKRVPGGLYITIEGPSCTGKDTQIALLATHFREQGYAVMRTLQPGGTAIGAGIRQVLLRPDLRPQFTVKTEAMLYWADRVQHHETVVKPALAEGVIVLGSRDFDSSYVYQCALHGLSEEWMDQLRALLIGDFTPTRTILLLIDEHTFSIRSENRKLISVVDKGEMTNKPYNASQRYAKRLSSAQHKSRTASQQSTQNEASATYKKTYAQSSQHSSTRANSVNEPYREHPYPSTARDSQQLLSCRHNTNRHDASQARASQTCQS
jgi:dTMP kinase